MKSKLGLPHVIMIHSEKGCNAGRYLNCSDHQHKKNCKPVIGILHGNEITIYIVAIRNIAAGEELFFDYGRLYPSFNQPSEGFPYYREEEEEKEEVEREEEDSEDNSIFESS